MNRLFLFCIGGTGVRVLKSLTFLLASGVKINARQIIPIIVDPDKDNGDGELTIRMLNYYSTIRNQAQSNKSSFFVPEISKLSSIGDNSGHSHSDIDVNKSFKADISVGGDSTHGETFRNFIEYDLLDTETKALMQLLYSEKNNLDSDLTVGFKGNPHMGSVVLNRLKDSKDFEYFVSQLAPGDRIFVVSSIFGGTGAAGFPLIIKNIRQPDDKFVGKKAVMQSAPLGAISVLPYFGVKPDASSSINKNTFISKTKAALSFYGTDLRGINTLYYVGDVVHKDYDNVEGARNQKNDAHFVEMASALSVIDFMNQPDAEVQQGSHKEFGIHAEDNARTFNFKELGHQTRAIIAKPLCQLFYSLQHWRNRLKEDVKDSNIVYIKGNPKIKSTKIEPTFVSSNFYNNNLLPFVTEFENWLKQMSTNERGFASFNFTTKELCYMIQGVEQKAKGFLFKSPKWDYNDFGDALNTAEQEMGGLTAEQKFLALFSKATEHLYDERMKDGLQ